MIPWKLLGAILIMTVVLVFVGFNLENRCDISLAVATLPQVPVIVTILASFVLGLLTALIMTLGKGLRKSGGRTRGKSAAAANAGISGQTGDAPHKPSIGNESVPAGNP